MVLVADAGAGAGLGHLSRSSALGGALERRGLEIAAHALGAEAPLERDGVRWTPLAGVADLDLAGASAVVLDSYRARPGELPPGPPLALMHDQAGVPSRAGLVVGVAARPAGDRRVLAGPRYACLRRMFAGLPAPAQPDAVARVLVSAGGTAARGLGGRIAGAVAAGVQGAAVALVIPPSVDDEPPEGVEAIDAPDSLLDPLRKADLVVTAAGQTMLEALAVGTPCVAVVTADNQQRQAERMDELGTIALAPSVDPIEVAGVAMALAGDPGGRRRFSARGRELVDGMGADRVAAAVASLAEAA